MKGPTVAELTPNQNITAVFLVQSKELRQKSSGEPYLSLVLGDRSGEIDAKMWDNVSEVAESFERDDFVRVKGETILYNNRLQLRIHRIQPVPEREVDLGEFLPVSQRDPDEMFAELGRVIAGMKDPWLKKLLETIFADQAVALAYRRAPAAKGIHHAWLGGLIEHVLSLVDLARFAAQHYPLIDEDLLLAGVILHDIGKISELKYERSFSYTSDGQLLGHIQIGLRLVGDAVARLAGFPPKLRNLVEHMILSHHGQLEFGSPKVPLFAEALLLHHLDNLDSKMETLRSALEKEKNAAAEWTAFNYALDRPLMNKHRYLMGETPPAAPAAKPGPASKPDASAGGGKKAQSTLFGEQLLGALGKDK